MSSIDTAPPSVLAIAGSDSGGGAGIQADLKALTRCGVHATCAVTAITAQNTLGVDAVYPVPAQAIVDQVRSVTSDIRIEAVKIGMLGTVEVVEAVEHALAGLDVPVVLDPVMVAESGATLLDDDARQALRQQLVPRAAVITPNLLEARLLADRAHGEEDREQLVRDLLELGPRAVVLTGGHSEDAADLFFDGERVVRIPGERHPDGASHGSGCTHSSALAAYLAHGLAPLDAARRAKKIASEAVRNGLRGIGAGTGPVDVFALATP